MRVPFHLVYLSPILYGIGCSSIPTDHGVYHSVSDNSSLAPNDGLARGRQLRADGVVPIPLVKRTLIDDRCTGEAYNKMENAYFEVVDALVTAIGRTEELRDWLKLFPTGAPSDDDVKSALLTFEVIFGKVYGSHGQIQAGLDTIQQVIDDAKAILSTIYTEDETAPPTFDWYCSNEAWLEPLGGKRYLDMFSPRGLGQNEIELDHICDDNPRGLVAFMTHYEDLIDTLYATDRLTFCPARLETLDWSLEDARQMVVNGDRVHLDHLEEHTVGLNFLHELGHLQVAMGIDGAYADVPWAGGPNGKAYGWAAIRAITPALAERNADNFAYWVIAMFLDDCDWHTGWALPFEDMPDYGQHM